VDDPSPRRELEPKLFWKWSALAWAGLAVFGFTIRWILHGRPGPALGLTLVQESLAFFLSGILWMVYRRPGISDPFRISTAAWIVGLSLLAVLVQSVVAWWVSGPAEWRYPGWTPREEWFFRVTFAWLLYIVWSLTIFTLRSRHLAEDATNTARRMELRLLRAQLDPHFLFNALNGIAAQIPANPSAAVEMVHQLCDYFRYSLGHRNTLLAPLSAELDAVGAYLKIEQARFGDRLAASVESDPAAEACAVPSFLLQPLVENAVKHGLGADRCEIKITAKKDADTLRIGVSNPGRLPPGLEVSEGVGLETVRRRLEIHYPGRFTFELGRMNGIVTAEVVVKGDPCSG